MVDVVFQHNDFYIVSKPANLSINDLHSDGQIQTGFFNQCQAHFNEKLYPVHRLDKITSGLLILARNLAAANWFQMAFEQREIQKYYIALAAKPKKKQGSIVGDMKKMRDSKWKLLQSKVNPAITRFISFTLPMINNLSLRLFLVKPKTGRTHQIRVALKSLAAPILGDGLYGGLTSDRGYLHAYALMFNYNNELIQIEHFPSEGEYFEQHKAEIHHQLENLYNVKWPGEKT